MKDVLEMLGIFLVIALAFCVLGLALAATFNFFEYPICQDLKVLSDFTYRWTFFTGCRVLVNGAWVHYSDITYDLHSGDLQIELDD